MLSVDYNLPNEISALKEEEEKKNQGQTLFPIEVKIYYFIFFAINTNRI